MLFTKWFLNFRGWWCRFLLLFVLSGQTLSSLARPEERLLGVEGIFLSSYQAENLSKDEPLQDLFLDKSKGVWLLGQKYFWFFHFGSKRLSQIQLPTKASVKPQSMLHLDHKPGQFLIACDDRILLLALSQTKGFTVEKDIAIAQAHDLQSVQEQVFFRSPGGLYALDLSDLALRKYSDLPSGVKQGFYQRESDNYWFRSDNELWLLKALTSKNPSRSLVHHSNFPYVGLFPYRQDQILLTAHTLLQFSSAGDIVQTVPVEGQRKIVQAYMNEEQHSFLFNDGHLEIVDLKKEKKSFAYLASKIEANVTQFRKRGQFIAFIVNGKVRLYQVEAN